VSQFNFSLVVDHLFGAVSDNGPMKFEVVRNQHPLPSMSFCNLNQASEVPIAPCRVVIPGQLRGAYALGGGSQSTVSGANLFPSQLGMSATYIGSSISVVTNLVAGSVIPAGASAAHVGINRWRISAYSCGNSDGQSVSRVIDWEGASAGSTIAMNGTFWMEISPRGSALQSVATMSSDALSIGRTHNVNVQGAVSRAFDNPSQTLVRRVFTGSQYDEVCRRQGQLIHTV
jgi:hypothetical protein